MKELLGFARKVKTLRLNLQLENLLMMRLKELLDEVIGVVIDEVELKKKSMVMNTMLKI